MIAAYPVFFINVIARSGSSFVGDLLTLNPQSTYIYEPLRPLQWPWKDSFLGDWTQDGLDKIVAKIMGVFKCDPVNRYKLCYISAVASL